MEIDLFELPIPDWNIGCPQCGYPLRGLPSHRCPECGLEFDIPSILQPWHRLRDPRFTGDELPVPDFGLACGECGQPLAGATLHKCPHCDTPFDLLDLRPEGDWFRLDTVFGGPISSQFIGPILAGEYIPYNVQREPSHGMLPLDEQLMVPSEFYFDVLWLIEHELAQMPRLETRDPRISWRCAHCREENPDTFDVCWNCSRPRGGQEA
jgi:hypothetical protein